MLLYQGFIRPSYDYPGIQDIYRGIDSFDYSIRISYNGDEKEGNQHVETKNADYTSTKAFYLS